MYAAQLLRIFCFLTLLLVPGFQSPADSPQIVSDERPLFGERSHLDKPGNLKGATASIDPVSRSLRIEFSGPNTGAGVRCLLESTRFNPIPYLGDAFPALEITFREIGTPPESVVIGLQTLDGSSTKKTVNTESVSTTKAVAQSDGGKVLRLPFDGKNPDITAEDLIERVLVSGSSAGALEISKIAFVRLRNVSLNLSKTKNPANLVITGRTAEPTAEVELKITDASGKKHVQKVRATSGEYAFTWENAPLIFGKLNTLTASVAGGITPENRSVPREVFGHLSNTDHVWLSVQGRDIVTSPASLGGARPFYSVGAGYCKNVIVRGYDEEVAAYCKSMSLNTLRLAFYTTHFNNRAAEPLEFKDITAFVDPVVEAAKRNGLYVILDDHSYFKNEIVEETARGEQQSGGWTEERFQNWVNRWVEVATYYKDEPFILGYELCNEPVCEPETARKWYKRCVDAIRKVDQRHILLLGTHNWSHARAMEATWEGVAASVDAPFNNVVFSFHDYPMDNNPWEVQAHLRAFQKKYNVPVLCTEFGGGGKPERVHREFQAGMLSMFAFDRVGWMIWALDYEPKSASGFPTKAVRDETNKTWSIIPENPGYWIPFIELWAPAAKIMATPFPQPAATPAP